MAFGSSYSPTSSSEEERIKRGGTQRPQQSLQTLSLQPPKSFDPSNISNALAGGLSRLSAISGDVEDGADENTRRMSALINALSSRRIGGGSNTRPFGGMTTRPPTTAAPPRFTGQGGSQAGAGVAAPGPSPQAAANAMGSGVKNAVSAGRSAAEQAAYEAQRAIRRARQKGTKPAAPGAAPTPAPINPEIIGGGALEPTPPAQGGPPPGYYDTSTGGGSHYSQTPSGGSYYDSQKGMWITPGFTRGY